MDEPTRDQNILDLTLTTNVDLIDNILAGEPFSDHNSITFTLNSAPYMSRISKKFAYALKKADWSNLTSLFQYSAWDLALAGEDINDNWKAWKDIFFAAVDDCIPKYRQKKRLTAPWRTKDLIKFCRKKKSLEEMKHGQLIELQITHRKRNATQLNGNTLGESRKNWKQTTILNHSGTI